MPLNWIILIFAIGIGMLCAFAIPVIQGWLFDRKFGKELDEPFSAEVLYHGQVVADLSDRNFIEMLWREYRIEPRSAEVKQIIENDDLWGNCVFDFRDPKTGNVCTTGWVGGTRPFVRNGRISLRALYFGGKAHKPI